MTRSSHLPERFNATKAPLTPENSVPDLLPPLLFPRLPRGDLTREVPRREG